MDKLFKVCHKDGREWTKREIAKCYVDDPERIEDNVTFFVDDTGYPTAEVMIGKELFDFGYDFKVVWNKEMFKNE